MVAPNHVPAALKALTELYFCAAALGSIADVLPSRCGGLKQRVLADAGGLLDSLDGLSESDGDMLVAWCRDCHQPQRRITFLQQAAASVGGDTGSMNLTFLVNVATSAICRPEISDRTRGTPAPGFFSNSRKAAATSRVD